MTRNDYYQEMRQLALIKRAQYRVETTTLNLTVIRNIYKQEGIRIDNWELKGRKIKAMYFCDEVDCSVLVNKKLPRIPRLFALVHELKHHFADREKILDGQIKCGDYNSNELIEKAAEVFAGEFIYPEEEMLLLAKDLNVHSGSCTAEKIVEFKRACPAKISYAFIVKRFEWFNFIPEGIYLKTQFQKLEESLYGIPFYKEESFKMRRRS